MESVRNFINTRRTKIEKELEEWPVRVPDRPRKPIYTVDVGSARGTFTTKWRELSPAKIVETGELKLDLALNDNKIAVKTSGASVHRPRKGMFGFGSRTPKEEQTTEIIIAGVRESDGKLLTLTLPVDTQELSANVGKPVAVRGSFANGDERRGGFMPFGGQVVSGTVTLTRADLKRDGIVEGRFDLTISEVRGGFMDRRPGQGGPGREGRPPRAGERDRGELPKEQGRKN
jgi:hypothetical protein